MSDKFWLKYYIFFILKSELLRLATGLQNDNDMAYLDIIWQWEIWFDS